MKLVKVLDKLVPYELIHKYIVVLWTYTEDNVRSRAHDAIFEYMGLDRWDDDNDGYVDVIDDFVMYSFMCCGLSVDRNNRCFECGTQLTMQMSLFDLDSYLEKNNLIVNE